METPTGETTERGERSHAAGTQHSAELPATRGERTERGAPKDSGETIHRGGTAETGAYTTASLRTAVARARETQWRRNRRGEQGYGGMEWLNARLEPAEIERICRLTERSRAFFATELRSGALSGRGGHGILKVARTIADMEGCDDIHEEHLAEAVSFRTWGVSVPDFLLDV